MVAQHIMGHPVSVGAAVGPGVFHRRGEAAAHDHVECDRGVFGLVEADADGSQRLDHAVVNGSDIGARRVRGQPPTAAHGPLLGAARHTPAAPSKTPLLVYLPMPRTSCSELSRAWAVVQIFSVQDGSDWLTVANVSTIWWVSSSSSGTRFP